MAAWRRSKEDRNECQRCPLPAHFDWIKRKRRRLCLFHLEIDATRKKGERRE